MRANEVWVSDKTDIWLIDLKKFCYLYLITNTYLRKIIGYCLSEDLTSTVAIAALKMLMKAILEAFCLKDSDKYLIETLRYPSKQ